jgi:predicted peroxiredoxin
MRLMSHAHINGNGTQFRDEYARIAARACKTRNITHMVVGCHGSYIASRATMDEVRKIGVVPIRFAELNIRASKQHKRHSHVAVINIPNKKIERYQKNETTIQELLPYAKDVGCRIVLCHPSSIREITEFAPYIDGYELTNGEDSNRNFTDRNALPYFPDLVQFHGADYHVWKGKGDPNLFTELPDDWFGELYK